MTLSMMPGTSRSGDRRRKQIIEILRKQDEVSVDELSDLLQVSKVTIRKDLQHLEDQGYLTRMWGGAVFSGRGQLELRFAARQQISLEEKRRIAERAVHCIPPDSTIFLDGSSTVFQMTRLLHDREGLTVVTNGLYAALELSYSPSITTIVVGGIVRRRSSSLVDMLSPDLLARLHIDIAFLSCRGLTAEKGMMESDLREARIKRAMAQAAQRVVGLVDSSKIGQSYTSSSVLLDEVDLLLVDEALPVEMAARLRATGCRLEMV